jgi:dihydrofolate reductase
LDEFYQSVDTVLGGRKAYDLALALQKKGMAGAAFDTRLKNYVFSRTLKASDTVAGVQLVDEPVKAFAARLRSGKGKNIWMMGGGGIIASFLDEGVIDEFIISVIPKFIGEGIPLIAPRHRHVTLKLLSSKTFPDGVVKLHYAVQK